MPAMMDIVERAQSVAPFALILDYSLFLFTFPFFGNCRTHNAAADAWVGDFIDGRINYVAQNDVRECVRARLRVHRITWPVARYGMHNGEQTQNSNLNSMMHSCI